MIICWFMNFSSKLWTSFAERPIIQIIDRNHISTVSIPARYFSVIYSSLWFIIKGSSNEVSCMCHIRLRSVGLLIIYIYIYIYSYSWNQVHFKTTVKIYHSYDLLSWRNNAFDAFKRNSCVIKENIEETIELRQGEIGKIILTITIILIMLR